jgi:hypothetical protein
MPPVPDVLFFHSAVVAAHCDVSQARPDGNDGGSATLCYVHLYDRVHTSNADAGLFWNWVNSSKMVGLSTSVSEATNSVRAPYREEEVY